MLTVYLCGGINALSDAEAKDWREEAKRRLDGERFDFLDPMRRDYRGKERENSADIVKNDLDDIKWSDLILVNASRPSWGTAMEIVYAHSQGARIIAFGIEDASKASPWLMYHCAAILQTLEQAIEVINAWDRTEDQC